jgi:hypothetical protein
MPSTLVEQLSKALRQKQRPQKHLWQEMDGLGFKQDPPPVMQHARTLPSLDDDGNVLNMLDGGRVAKKTNSIPEII